MAVYKMTHSSSSEASGELMGKIGTAILLYIVLYISEQINNFAQVSKQAQVWLKVSEGEIIFQLV